VFWTQLGPSGRLGGTKEKVTYGERIRHPALALDPLERQRRWFWDLLLLNLPLLAFVFLPLLLVLLGVAKREAGSPISNPMGWV
jgi:hypothetical protein